MRNQQRKISTPRLEQQLTPKKRSASEGRPPDGLLTWKEISDYAGRGVRTLQRWERDFEFPVHRPDQRNKSIVVSSKSEIDEWFRTRPIMQHGVMTQVHTVSPKDLTISAHKVELEAHRLRDSSREIQERLKKAMEMARLRKIS
ncbi:MAG: hypothetical protein JWO13_2538 [Acidobacteriales bacterium]|nr:hypothetical protein [Terriglobales bacterium]